MYNRPRPGSSDRNSLSRKLQKVKLSTVWQSELIAATIGWLQASVAVAPDPFTLHAVTDSAFSGTLNGMKMLLMSKYVEPPTVYASTLGSPSVKEWAQLELGTPPRSVKVFPPSVEKPKPVSSSLFIGEPQGAKNPVPSFHASTTYGPAEAIEVSDCP